MSSRLPGVISSVSVNPLLTSGTSSTRKPVIFGVGDTKVLIENERIIRGTGNSDAITNTVYGSNTTIQLANVIRIGNALNSKDYAKTTDYTINGSGEVDWAGAATAPVSGTEYYVTYYKAISNTTITEYVSEGDIKAAHGDTYFASTRQFATVSASGSPANTTFTWANDETITTPTDWAITFISGPNTGESRTTATYAASAFTVSPAFSNSVSVGDIFLIENTVPTVNMLTAGSIVALRNGAESVKVAQLDNSAFSDALNPTNSEYSTALNTHLASLQTDKDLPYYLVPMLPNNSTTFTTNMIAQTSAINPVWNHCKLMSAPANKGERTCVAGFLAGTTTDEFKAFGVAYFNTRMVIAAPGDLEFIDATGITLNGSIGAAAWAGKYCSRSSFQSLLNEALVGISVVTSFYNSTEQRDLTSKGISFLILEAGIVKVVASKTTDTTSADTEDVAVVSIADHLNKTVRENLQATFVGQAINPSLLGAVGGKMSSIFERSITEQVIEEYDASSITVRQSSEEPRLIQVTASVKPLYTLWWLDVTMAFYV